MSMAEGFSFFTKSQFSTWYTRGTQVCEYLGGKLNPANGYEKDVCIFVKSVPDKMIEPPVTYYDLVDPRDELVKRVKRQTKGSVIAISKTQEERFKKIFSDRDVVFIPEHHCNFERSKRPDRPVKTVGCIGSRFNAIQYSRDKLSEMLADIGLKWEFSGYYKVRQDVIDFYNKIDIQICYRTAWDAEKGRMEDKNPLKPSNAGSFGIPTVAYPEVAYVREWPTECLYGNTMEEIVAQVKRLKDDPGFYKERAEIAKEKAEEYHIEHISKRYLKLLGEEDPMGRFRFAGNLLDKEAKIDGKMEPVCGLASLSVRPRREGFGTELIKSIDATARKKGKWGVVCFTTQKIWRFYEQAGWFKHQRFESPNYPSRIIVTSRPCKEIEVTEGW